MATNGTLAFKGFATDGAQSVRYVEVHVVDGAIAAYLNQRIAGEVNPTSTDNAYLTTRPTVNITRVNATGTTIISNAPAHFMGFISNATTGGNISFFNAAASGITATAFAVKTSNADFVMPWGGICSTGLAMSNTASGTSLDVTVLWRPI